MGDLRRKTSLDLDRKAQLDVEQALNLESIALEEFRLRKAKKQASQKQLQCHQTQQSTSSWQEKSQGTGTRKMSFDKIEPRSRPRPGSFNTGAGSSAILAPPPVASRRNNSFASPSGADQSDLISFSSPSEGKRRSLDQQIDFDELCSRLEAPPSESSSEKILNNAGSTSNPTLLVNPSLQLPQDFPGSLSHSVSENSSIGPPRFAPFVNISRCLSMNQSMSAPASAGTTPTQTIVPYRTNESLFRISPQQAASHNTFLDTSSSSSDVLRILNRRPNSNLIDLTSGPTTNARASVLEAFDPLLSGSNSETGYTTEDGSSCQVTNSVYDPYDPFDFMYSRSEGSQSDPVYAAVVKKERPPPDSPAAPSPPPLPPRNYAKKAVTSDKEKSVRKSLLKDLTNTDQVGVVYSSDLRAFQEMVLALRSEYSWDDPTTNFGLIKSATIDSSYEKNYEIKIVVYPSKSVGGVDAQAVTFTRDVMSTVDRILREVVCELEGDASVDVNDYALRVWGLSEYLTPQSSLSDYEYVHNCVKLEQDVQLTVVRLSSIDRPLARTAQDDVRDLSLTLEDLLPNDPDPPISYDTLHILLETLEKELNRLQVFTKGLQTRNVVQAVKAICALLGSIESSSITEALENLVALCSSLQQSPLYHDSESQPQRPEIVSEDGDYSMVALKRRTTASDATMSPSAASLANHCERVRDAVERLIQSYCRTFRVNFLLRPSPGFSQGSRCITDMRDSLLVHVDGLHRLLPKWEHEEFLIAGQAYHGTRPVGPTVVSQFTAPGNSFYPHVMFNCWLDFSSLSMSLLPREARLVLVLYGLIHTKPNENGGAGSNNNGNERTGISNPAIGEEPTKEELGWTAIQLFDYEGVLAQGGFLLALWPCEADKRWGPAPPTSIHPHGNSHPVLGIELPDFGVQVLFPEPDLESSVAPTCDFESLDINTQQQLLSIIENDSFTRPPPEDREVLWEKRYYLHKHPEALGKVILAARSWEVAPRADLHALLHSWTPLTPVQALQLLLPCFPDAEVRRAAVAWISELSSDELLDFLPQLVQVLKHETYLTSPLAALLFRRSLSSPRVAHHLYWLLTQGLPGNFPQNSAVETQILASDDHGLAAARHQSRLQLMLRALLAITGDALRQRFMSQQLLVKSFLDVAENVKNTKESLRMTSLTRDLERVQHVLEEIGPTCLPLSPALEVRGVHVRSSSYFPSNTLPLKIGFEGVHGGITPAIFKVGDDLQQDMLTIQMIRIMDKLWLKEGLDLKMVTFACVPTGDKRGMIEMVQDADTLRRIQVELGVAGSFKDRPIAEWLAKHNPSALEYERAVHNFTASCAGYSVATYILGICDRHNDNIMLKKSGHLFHIDFGKFLGDAQMFGNFKRDRVPFVLTSDMAYVINGGDKPSKKFQYFVDLCCQAFNIIRNHGNLILNLFGMMASSGIPGVTMDAVSYVQSALLPDLSNPVAAAYFTRMIQSSLKSWFTSFNFFLHNLAQLRFSPDHNDGELLNFIPKTYTMQQEGRIRSVVVFGVQKRYDPEKYYVYILRLERYNQIDPTYLFRSYKEFCELQQKLCIHFPLAKCHSLPTKMHVGRSNIKQVAEKRRTDIERFLLTLFQMADEIAHSDLVYTFFHPLLRDQQEASIHATKLKERKSSKRNAIESHLIKGQLRLSLHYQRDTLMVMVHHARDLPTVAGGQEPSSYVKVYLLPDPTKVTKRKTKVVRRSCHPVFMEMLEYRMSLDVVQRRVLQATVWNQDTLQENDFLGGVSLPLENVELCGQTETVEWYSLGNVHRSAMDLARNSKRAHLAAPCEIHSIPANTNFQEKESPETNGSSLLLPTVQAAYSFYNRFFFFRCTCYVHVRYTSDTWK